MIKLSLNLPVKYRLHLEIVKRRRVGNGNLSLFPKLEDIKRIRAGSRISRYFRHIFEHKNTRKIFGTNLALAIIATGLVPNPTEAADIQTEETVISQNQIVLPKEKAVRFPLNETKINQGFKIYHPGIDIDGNKGDAVYPVMNGKVEAVDYSRFAYGNAVVVKHDGGTSSLYAHLSKIEVGKDQEVTINTKIGEVGSTGRSTGPHLHLEIRDHGRPINPSSILPR